MAVSVDNRLIGLFTDKGRLWIGSSDLQGKGCEIDTSHACRPFQLAWYVLNETDVDVGMCLYCTLYS